MESEFVIKSRDEQSRGVESIQIHVKKIAFRTTTVTVSHPKKERTRKCDEE